METEWKEFEELVARIEKAFAPYEAVVKTNDWIKNNLTGRKRQVDASIRYTIGTVPILITIECRKRKHKQDDTWIEQLVTKKQNIGADATIAVASEDISEQAKINAKFYGIEFRRFSEINQEDILGWASIKEIKHIIYCPEIMSVSIAAYTDSNEPTMALHPNVLEQVKNNPNAQIFVHQNGDKNYGINAILDTVIRDGVDLRSGVPLDGTKIEKRIVIDFPRSVISVNTSNGMRDLAKLTIGIMIYTIVKTVSISQKGFAYSGGDNSTVFGIESKTDLFGNDVIVSIYKQENENILHVSITRGKGKKNR